MQSVGESLRAARTSGGLTLEEVSARTRISIKNLRAIEADELGSMSSAFFYKSFVRQFANELKLEFSLLAPAVQAAASTIPEPLVPGQGDTAAPKVSRLRRPRRSNRRWFLSFASLAGMVIACSTVYAMWQSSRAGLHASIASFVNSVTSVAKQPAAKKTHAVQPAHPPVAENHVTENHVTEKQAEAAPATMTAEASLPPSNFFELKLSALEATWLSVAADGKEIFTGTLKPSEIKVLEGHEKALVRAGNAGGLSVEFNGKLLGRLGPRGQVRTVVFTKDRYEIVPSAAPLALAQFTLRGE